LKRIFVTLLVTGVFGYFALVGLLYVKQRELVFAATNVNPPIAQLDLGDAVQIEIKTPDGEKLVGFYHAAKPSRPVILFFHGKGGKLLNVVKKLRYFAAKDFGYLAIDYRGVGGSTGVTSKDGMIIDGLAGYDWLIENGATSTSIVVLGESLGTGIAVAVAAKRDVAAVALGAPYTSIAAVAAERYWFVPVKQLLIDNIDPSSMIAEVTAPLFIAHGKLDTTIPFHFGQSLFEMANQPKRFLPIENAGHEALFHTEVWDSYLQFFELTLVH
jgi:uncharacterized protein